MIAVVNARHAATVLVGLTLAGCSALQIDVDVYKGPLLHTPDVQLRQYAYMAVSAKPLINRMVAKVQAKAKECEKNPSGKDCEANQDMQRFLDEIRTTYGETPQTGSNERFDEGKLLNRQRGKPARGIDQLTQELADALQRKALKPKDHVIEREIRAATDALNEKLIQFAQQVLFVVNNEQLFDELTGDDSGTLRAHKQVLQSLANTLLVHANDLSRQRERLDGLDRRKGSELRAIYGAFTLGPREGFERIVEAATSAAPGTSALEKPLEPPLDPRPPGLTRLASLEGQRDTSRNAMRSMRTEQADLVAAMQSLVLEPPAGDKELADAVESAERTARNADRVAVARLYLSTEDAIDADRTVDGQLTPVRNWLQSAIGSQAAPPERVTRYRQTVAYLERLAPRLTPLKAEEAPKKGHILRVLREKIEGEFSAVNVQFKAKVKEVDERESDLANQRRLVAQVQSDYEKSNVAAREAAVRANEGKRIKAVLESIRTDVLKDADRLPSRM